MPFPFRSYSHLVHRTIELRAVKKRNFFPKQLISENRGSWSGLCWPPLPPPPVAKLLLCIPEPKWLLIPTTKNKGSGWVKQQLLLDHIPFFLSHSMSGAALSFSILQFWRRTQRAVSLPPHPSFSFREQFISLKKQSRLRNIQHSVIKNITKKSGATRKML